jgi:hypothetical protein
LFADTSFGTSALNPEALVGGGLYLLTAFIFSRDARSPSSPSHSEYVMLYHCRAHSAPRLLPAPGTWTTINHEDKRHT